MSQELGYYFALEALHELGITKDKLQLYTVKEITAIMSIKDEKDRAEEMFRKNIMKLLGGRQEVQWR